MIVSELIEKLKGFDPKGFLLFTYRNDYGKDVAALVTCASFMNVETYGLFYDGVDYSEGKDNSDFVGLPFYLEAALETKEPGKKYSRAIDATSKYELNSPAMPIKEILELLSERKSDAEIIGFNHMGVSEVRQFDNKSKVVELSHEQTGRYSGCSLTEGINPNKIAELVAGKKYESKFDPERISRRETAGMTMRQRAAAAKNMNESKNAVMNYTEFVNESKKENKSVILEILKKYDKPILDDDLLKKWQKATGASSSSDDVLKFYTELSGLGKKVKKEREGKKLYLSINK